MAKVSLEKDKIKFLLVEGVHQKALDSLRAAGYTNIEFHKGALDTEGLKALLLRRKSWWRLAVSASAPTRLI